MGALVVLAVLAGAAAAAWLLYVAVRRGRALRRQHAAWAPEQWTHRGHTVIGVRRRPNPELVTDQVVVASICDSDTDWLDKRAAAWAEAQQRAADLNSTRP